MHVAIFSFSVEVHQLLLPPLRLESTTMHAAPRTRLMIAPPGQATSAQWKPRTSVRCTRQVPCKPVQALEPALAEATTFVQQRWPTLCFRRHNSPTSSPGCARMHAVWEASLAPQLLKRRSDKCDPLSGQRPTAGPPCVGTYTLSAYGHYVWGRLYC